MTKKLGLPAAIMLVAMLGGVSMPAVAGGPVIGGKLQATVIQKGLTLASAEDESVAAVERGVI